jgi:hypothetical protein
MKPTPVLIVLLIFCAVCLPSPRADKSAAATDANLTPEEKAEKKARKNCKVDLCKAFHTKETAGNDVACHVVKSWQSS